jgi:DNA-binding transcriptional LysR family regulator
MGSAPPLRKLQYVLAVAHELHFRKAAERLNVSQPSMSRQIREFEAEIGFDIFHRDHHFVALTEPGRAFVAAAEQIMERLEQDFTRAVDTARAMHRQNALEFTIGHSSYISSAMRLQIRRIQRAAFPKLHLRFRSMFPIDLLHALDSGLVQACLTFEPLGREGLEKIPLWAESLYAIVPKASTLGLRQRLMLTDLHGCPVICACPAQTHPALHQWILDQCVRAGFEPSVVEEVNSIQEAFDLAQAEVGVAILPHNACFNLPSNLRSLLISDAEPLPLVFVVHGDCPEHVRQITNEIGDALRRKQPKSRN